MKPAGFQIWMAAALAFAFALPAKAHRLDEYLQATRIDLSSNRVDLEIDLTPGVEVVAEVLAMMDTNHDGFISVGEGEAYAKLVLQSVVLEMDKQRQPVKLTSIRYPTVSEMKTGTGVIHLRAIAEFAPLILGPHLLYLQNQHATNASVYLINAYFPRSSAIKITRQTRDDRQTKIWIDFTFAQPVAADPAPRERL